MTENGRQKPRKGEAALLAALAAGATVRDAARQAGISERTASRCMEDPGFRQRVQEAKAEIVARAASQLADAATDAAKTLRDLLEAEADSIKLGAARAILELGTKLRESVELEQRLAALEAGLETRRK